MLLVIDKLEGHEGQVELIEVLEEIKENLFNSFFYIYVIIPADD